MAVISLIERRPKQSTTVRLRGHRARPGQCAEGGVGDGRLAAAGRTHDETYLPRLVVARQLYRETNACGFALGQIEHALHLADAERRTDGTGDYSINAAIGNLVFGVRGKGVPGLFHRDNWDYQLPQLRERWPFGRCGFRFF